MSTDEEKLDQLRHARETQGALVANTAPASLTPPGPPPVPTSERREQLAHAEEVIERNLASFVEVGEALLHIREERLYHEANCSTFEEYVKVRWDLSRRYAYNLVDAARVCAIAHD